MYWTNPLSMCHNVFVHFVQHAQTTLRRNHQNLKHSNHLGWHVRRVGLHLQTTQNANAVQVVLSISDLVCQRAGTESALTFSLQTREHCSFVCVAFTMFCMSICIDIFGQCKNPWLHFLMKVYSFWPYCVLQKRFLKLNIAFFCLWREMCTEICARILFLAKGPSSSEGICETFLLYELAYRYALIWQGRPEKVKSSLGLTCGVSVVARDEPFIINFHKPGSGLKISLKVERERHLYRAKTTEVLINPDLRM